MVDIPTLQTVSIAIASAGVFAAAIYYILQLNHQGKSRRTDSYWRILSTFNSREYLEAIMEVMSLDFKDYNNFHKQIRYPFFRKRHS